MSQRLGRPVHPTRGWEMLRRLDYRLGLPRPRHTAASPEVQAAFKGGLAKQVNELAQAHPAAPVAVWTMDEHRVGLKPIARRVWHRRGQQPLVPCRPRYQWLYEYAFVHPVTGETFWLLLLTVSTAMFTQALAQFAAALGVGPALQVVLVLDQAGWHRSHELVVPDGLTLVFLPPYSPELQPAERLWALSDEPLANRVFVSLDDPEAVLSERCRDLQTHPDLVAGRVHFHWWPDSLLPTVA